MTFLPCSLKIGELCVLDLALCNIYSHTSTLNVHMRSTKFIIRATHRNRGKLSFQVLTAFLAATKTSSTL